MEVKHRSRVKKAASIMLLSTLGVLTVIYLLRNPDKSLDELKIKYAKTGSSFIEIDSSLVHYRDEGSGTQCLLLLHGTAASLHTWDAWADSLKENYRVVRLDLPAFGLTGPGNTDQYTMAYYCQFLNKFLDALDIDTTVVIGNSLGGKIAWNMALRYPDRIKGMVLIAPSGLNSGDDMPLIIKMAATPLINQLLKIITPRIIIERNLKEVFYNDDLVTDELVERYHDMALRQGNRQAFIDRARTKEEGYPGDLARIQKPCLILWGEEDSWIDVKYASMFADQIPGASVHIMKNTGHVPMEEKPLESLSYLQSFLDKDVY